MLDEVTAQVDIEKLHPSADGQHRHVPPERLGQEAQLELVALFVLPAGAPVGRWP